jgi:hypothetical protein
MNTVKKFWSYVLQFLRAMEGMDDPVGEYMSSLGSRIDNLERDVARLEQQTGRN